MTKHYTKIKQSSNLYFHVVHVPNILTRKKLLLTLFVWFSKMTLRQKRDRPEERLLVNHWWRMRSADKYCLLQSCGLACITAQAQSDNPTCKLYWNKLTTVYDASFDNSHEENHTFSHWLKPSTLPDPAEHLPSFRIIHHSAYLESNLNPSVQFRCFLGTSFVCFTSSVLLLLTVLLNHFVVVRS